MNEQNDDLFKRLAAADPVNRDELPMATDPSAQASLENAMNQRSMNQNATHQDPSREGAAGEHPSLSDPDNPYAWPANAGSASEPVTAKAPTPIRRRNPLMLLSAAAVVLLVVGGLLVFSPDNTPSALATVHSAAATTADADSGRIATTFELAGTDETGEAQGIDGQFEASYSGSDIAVSLQVTEQTGSLVPAGIPVTDARLVDDVLYVDNDGSWFAVDTDGLLGGVVSEFVDPRTVFETVQELTEATEVGSETIDGVDTTHYQSVVDLQDESLSGAGWLAFEGLQVDAEGEITVDLYVDADGVLRQLDLSGNAQDNNGGSESGTFEVSTRFFDIGSDITVEAPADAELVDPLQGLFSDE